MPEESTSRDERVALRVEAGVAEVRMVRVDKRNALDMAMFRALVDAGERLTSEPGVRAAVVSGDGHSFCAGLDLAMFAERGAAREPRGPAALTPGGLTHVAQQVCWVWQEVPVPVIAAVHGHALGGGMQIALGADIRIVHPDAQLSVREVHWGLIPDMAGTLFLSRLVGDDVAKELVFTARVFDGHEALRLGLATRLSSTPRDDALALAAEIAGRSPDAIRAAKRLLNRPLLAQAAEQLAAERAEIHDLLRSPNHHEAIAANLERRAPAFTDP